MKFIVLTLHETIGRDNSGQVLVQYDTIKFAVRDWDDGKLYTLVSMDNDVHDIKVQEEPDAIQRLIYAAFQATIRPTCSA